MLPEDEGSAAETGAETQHDRRFFALVAVALPVPRFYHYLIPTDLQETLEVGHGVLVPFGPRKVSGFVLERLSEVSIDPARLRPIETLLFPEPVFDASLLALLRWTADYYHHPLGEVIRTALPAGLLVESRLTCQLTEKGQQSLASEGFAAGSVERILLEFLQLRGGLSWQRLLEVAPVPGVTGLVRRLQEQGLVELAQRLDEARAKARLVEVYRPGVSVSVRSLKGSLQQAIVETLAEMGEAEVSELREALEARGQKTSSLSGALKRLLEQGLVEQRVRENWRTGPEGLSVVDEAHTLNPEQGAALDRITTAMRSGTFSPILLHGVTGSGKTEVYMKAVAEALAMGRSAIVLVPEISLTPQLVGRFRARFGDGIACLHSGLSPGERFDAWRRLRAGLARVAIGARSALFAPLPDPALIVVDEEHDSSFKQESGLRYNARDLAVVRAQQAKAVVVLGSATPSLESSTNARRGRFELLSLTGRVADRPLPQVTLVDMTRLENRPRREDSPLSPPLEDALQETLAAGQQAIILLNRRGFAPFVLCGACGGSFRCLHCDISLTYHRRRRCLLCHYCGMSVALPDHCPHCGQEGLELLGQGTERLEQVLEEGFPGVPVARLDRDTTGTKDAYARILDAFRRGEQRILVGTQMVVKGHDFPAVTLVGIVQADYALNLPDFRASERTFQLVTQVAGRAGRGLEPGRVLVQTFAPRHPSIALAAQHDYEGFYRQELRLRRAHGYPPFARLTLLQISALDEEAAEGFARQVAGVLRGKLSGCPEGLEVLGPAPAPLSRLQQWFRWQVVVRAPSVAAIHALLKAAEADPGYQPSSLEVRLAVDVDPQSLL